MKFYPGFYDVLEELDTLSENELLDQLDALDGRSKLSRHYSIDELKHEVKRQTKLDWLDSSDPRYNQNRKRLEY